MKLSFSEKMIRRTQAEYVAGEITVEQLEIEIPYWLEFDRPRPVTPDPGKHISW